jgi:hypothetical protein
MDVNMESIIQFIQNSLKELFDESPILDKTNTFGRYILTSSYPSGAYNYHKNGQDLINVVKWFDKSGYEFWIYIEISFKKIQRSNIQDLNISKKKKKDNGIDRKAYFKSLSENNLKIDNDYFQVFLTISVFQGGYQPEQKRQLFRAEWDNFDNEGEPHPQPHWHFYPFNKHIDSVNYMKSSTNFTDFNKFNKEEEEGFLHEIKRDNEDLPFIKLERIHFVVNGNWNDSNWSDPKRHIHKINSQETIAYWLQGLLNHVKTQLKYAADK